MKWSVVVLLILGLVAAVCAALLFVSLQGGGGTATGGTQAPAAITDGREASYVVAARDLDARSVVESSAVEVVISPTKQVPANALMQPAEVIGQVLRKPMKRGQAFERSSFTSEGTGVVLAGALKDGKRAVSVPLTDSGGIEHLLYPGCMVDVLASLQLRDDKGLGDQPMSMTLLQGIYVLAVGDQTVVTPVTDDSRALVAKAPSSTITLLVDSKQAEMLYLARQRGQVSIALRNPMDTAAVGTQGTRLPSLSPVFADAEERILQRLGAEQRVIAEASKREQEKAQYDMERARSDIELARKQAEIARIELDKKKLETERAAEQTIKPQWETRILRGGAEEVRKFDVPEGKKSP
jgi:pilus assembly protein CpaB